MDSQFPAFIAEGTESGVTTSSDDDMEHDAYECTTDVNLPPIEREKHRRMMRSVKWRRATVISANYLKRQSTMPANSIAQAVDGTPLAAEKTELDSSRNWQRKSEIMDLPSELPRALTARLNDEASALPCQGVSSDSSMAPGILQNVSGGLNNGHVSPPLTENDVDGTLLDAGTPLVFSDQARLSRHGTFGECKSR